MAYQINKTDGTVIAQVADGQLDQLTTDLSLIGKNFSGFGESLNENFVKLLENFANVAPPTAPLQGQLWYDTSDGNIKVYNGTQFVPVSSAVVADSQPQTIGIGDLWYNNISRQLFFFNGTESVLLGPAFSASQGRSGLEVQSILDSQNQTRIITVFYINNTLFGIFSKDKFFPARPIVGYSENADGVLISKEILPGFNVGTHKVREVDPDTGQVSEFPLSFRVTAENAEQLGGQPAANYVRRDTSNTISGLLEIRSDLGVVLGNSALASLTVSNGNLVITNNNNQGEVSVNVRQGESPETAISIKPAIRSVEFYPEFEDSQTVVGGSLTVNGNLTVQGTTTTINTAELVVEDKSIELAKIENPDDEFADQGGIILQGDSEKIILWAKNPVDYELSPSQSMQLKSHAWNFSEHINIAKDRFLFLDGKQIFRNADNGKFALSEDVVELDGVSLIGKQTRITVGPGIVTDEPVLVIEGNTISIEPGTTDLVLSPTGNIQLTGSPRILGLQTPSDPQDAATKEYVDNTVGARNIVLSADVTDGTQPNQFADDILPLLAPVVEYQLNTLARVLSKTASGNSVWTFRVDETTSDPFKTWTFVNSVDL